MARAMDDDLMRRLREVNTVPDAAMELRNDDGGALVIRTARKIHRCSGDGRAHPLHADGCTREIRTGERYLEVLWEAPAYASGEHVSEPCARAFYDDWLVNPEPDAPAPAVRASAGAGAHLREYCCPACGRQSVIDPPPREPMPYCLGCDQARVIPVGRGRRSA